MRDINPSILWDHTNESTDTKVRQINHMDGLSAGHVCEIWGRGGIDDNARILGIDISDSARMNMMLALNRRP